MLAQMDSVELTGWWALLQVHEEEAEHQRDLAESGDGIVTVAGKDPDRDDDDEDEAPDDGEAE